MRHKLWQHHRLFYCTPQTLQNDLDRGIVDVQRVVCIVIDEAHKAKGNYAYTKVVQVYKTLLRKYVHILFCCSRNLCVSMIDFEFWHLVRPLAIL